MHVSVTTLGASPADIDRAARQIVGYLEGTKPEGANRRNLPGSRAPDASPIAAALQREGTGGGYYADAAEAPGRWRGAGSRPDAYDLGAFVQTEQFLRVLLGRHPHTGEQLVETRHHRVGPTTTHQPPSAEALTCAESAEKIGVSTSYVQRVVRRTAEIRARQADAAQAGAPAPELPATYLDARIIEGRWMIDQAELERFIGQRTEPKIVMGYDVTWSVPKSVSMLYAAGDDVLRGHIDGAIETAVQTGMTYLENEGFHVRARRGRSRAREMIAASYRHTTNRALEPQLHEHVVIANIATSPTGIVRAVDARGLFAHATPAGYLAAAQLRHDLRQLGIAWGPVHKGLADIAGVDRDQIMALSSRRQDVLSLSAELGYLTPQARQTAALATRPGKDTSVDREELFARWQELLSIVGIDSQRIAELTSHDPTRPLWSPLDTDKLFQHLSGSRGVTEQNAIFDRRHVIEAIATYAIDRLPAVEILDLADQWLSTEAVVELDVGDGARRDTIGTGAAQVSLTPDERRYTTPEMLDIETRVVDWHRQGIRSGYALVHPANVEAAITNNALELGVDQADLVRAFTTSGDQFQAAKGLAGSGKTTALCAASQAWKEAGYSVIGAAPFGEAARQLEAETGIAARTLESLLHRVELAGDPRQVIGSSTVIIIDEASTIGNRQLDRLYRAANETGATIRTIGDPGQHQSVEAGGLWAHLANRFNERTPVLATNRRQTGKDMAEVRLALDEYRTGLIAAAIERLDQDNRIVVAESWDDLLDQMAADWYIDHQRHQAGQTIGSQMIADRNIDRRALNRRAQTWLRDDGTLTHPTRIGDDTFHVGDRVVAQRPDKTLTGPDNGRAHVLNGSIGTVIGFRGDPEHRGLVVDFDHLGRIEVPHDYIATETSPGRGGGLTPAYAVTSYKAEGQTYDAARGLAAPGAVNTEGVYVALTRGRNDLRAYSIAPADQRDEPPELPIVGDARAAAQALADTLGRWRGADVATVADPDAARIRSLSTSALPDLDGVVGADAERARRSIESRIAGHAIANPDPALVAYVGPRPDSTTRRTEWDEAVSRHALYCHRWTASGDGDVLLPTLDGSEPQKRLEDHDVTNQAIENARARHLANISLDELRQMRQEIAQTQRPSPGIRETIAAQTRVAESAVQQLTNRRQVAHAQHLALATARRAQPDQVEMARRAARDSAIDLAAARQRLVIACQLEAAANGNPIATSEIERLIARLNEAINLKIVSAVHEPAPYLTTALGPRPVRHDPRREHWNQSASHLEAYRHKILGITPDKGALASSGVEAAIGPRPLDFSAAKLWLRAAGAAHRLHRLAGTSTPQVRRIT